MRNKEQFTVFDIVDLMEDVTLHVTLVRVTEMRWRVWMAMGLFSLAGWVLNCQVEVHGLGAEDER